MRVFCLAKQDYSPSTHCNTVIIILIVTICIHSIGDPILTTPTLREINEWVIPHIALDWYSVGKHLEIEQSVLKQIEQDNPHSVHLSCRDMFTRWLSGDRGTGCTPRLWKTVLMSIRSVGYTNVVGDIERLLVEHK